MKAEEKSVKDAGLGKGSPSLGLSFLICKIEGLYQTSSGLYPIVQLGEERREEGSQAVGKGYQGALERALPGSAASQRVSPGMASLVQFVFNIGDTLINVETALWIFVYKK